MSFVTVSRLLRRVECSDRLRRTPNEYQVCMRAQLIPLEGGSPVDVAKEMMLIGRQEDCDLRLDHKSVSKMHCVIVKTDGLLLLRDLGSTNGTRVNGTRVRRAAIEEVQPDSAVDQPILEVQKNALPDVYPEDKKKS